MKRRRLSLWPALLAILLALIPTAPPVYASTAAPEVVELPVWRAEATPQAPARPEAPDRERKPFAPRLRAATGTDTVNPEPAATSTLKMLDVAAGEEISVALRSDGTVWAWGSFYNEELGRDTEYTSEYYEPVKVLGLPPIAQIAAAGGHALALAQDGTVWQFGREMGEYVGGPPAKVPGLSGVKAIAAGYDHDLALTNNGTVYIWEGSGEYGDGAEAVKVEGLTGVTAIAAGSFDSLAVAGGSLWTWGWLSDVPEKVTAFDGLGTVKAAAMQMDTAVVLTSTGVYLWPLMSDSEPEAVPQSSGATAVEAYAHNYYVKTSAGEWLGWGDNEWGQLGNSTTDDAVDAPVSLGKHEHLAGGYYHTLLQDAGGIKASGGNFNGQLGDGTGEDALSPVTVKGLPLDTTAPQWDEFAIPDLKAQGKPGSTVLGVSWLEDDLTENDQVTRARIYVDGVKAAETTVYSTNAFVSNFDANKDHTIGLEVGDPSGNWSERIEAYWFQSPPSPEASAQTYSILLSYDRPIQETEPNPADYHYWINGEERGAADELFYYPSFGQILLLLPDVVMPEDQVALSYAGPTLYDLNGNALPAMDQMRVWNWTYDNGLPPRFRNAETSSSGEWLYLFFSRAMDRNAIPAGADFTVMVNGVAQEPPTVREVVLSTVYLELAEPVREGDVVTISYTPGETPLLDAFGRPAPEIVNAPVTNRVAPDRTPPVLMRSTAAGESLVLQFNEDLDPASVPAAGSFKVSVNSAPGTAPKLVWLDGNAVILKLSQPAAPGDPLTVTYKPGSKPLKDAAGNAAAAFTNRPVENLTSAVELLDATVDGNTLTLTYAEPLNTASVPDKSAYTVKLGAQAGKSPSKVAVDGNTVLLTLAVRAKEGDTVTVDYRPGTKPVVAVSGLRAGRLTSKSVTNQTTSPHLTDAWGDEHGLILAFDQELNPNVVPAPTDFALVVNGLRSPARAVYVTGDQVVIKLLPGVVRAGAVISIGYTPGKKPLQDLAGDAAGAFATYPVTNDSIYEDGWVPVLTGATVDGTKLTLTYNEPVLLGGVPLSSYAVKVGNGPAKAPVKIAVDGNTAVLTLAVAAAEGDAVTVDYKLGDKYLHDASGNPAQPFTGLAATNATVAPTLFAAYGQGNKVMVHYTEPLDPTSVPAPSAFTVIVGGNKVAVTKVAVDEYRAVLTLARTVKADESLTVQYNRPSARPLRDMTGTLVPSLPVTNVDNQTTTPYLMSAKVTGNRMSLGIFARLDPASLPPTTAFVVKENGKPIAVTKVTIIEQEVALKLARVVSEGSTVTVSYTGKGKPIQSWAAEAVEPFQDAAVEIAPHTTALQDARVDGNRLTLTYDAPLDSANTPAASSYTVMAGATKASVSKVTVQANRVTLTLAAPVQDVDTVTVSYAPGKKPLYDVFGQQVGALSALEAVNETLVPVLTDARVEGTVLTLTFSEELNPSKVPSTKDFTVVVHGQPRVRVTRVKINGATVELTLSESVIGGLTTSPRLSYKPGSVKLQDMTGSLVQAIIDHLL